MAKTNLVLFSEVAQIIVCRRQNLDDRIPNTFSDIYVLLFVPLGCSLGVDKVSCNAMTMQKHNHQPNSKVVDHL